MTLIFRFALLSLILFQTQSIEANAIGRTCQSYDREELPDYARERIGACCNAYMIEVSNCQFSQAFCQRQACRRAESEGCFSGYDRKDAIAHCIATGVFYMVPFINPRRNRIIPDDVHLPRPGENSPVFAGEADFSEDQIFE
jgi:hypothetical protein